MWKFINELNPKSRKPAPESVSEIDTPDKKSLNLAALIAIFPLFHTNFYL